VCGAVVERHAGVHPVLRSQAQVACRGEAGDDFATSAEDDAFGKTGGAGSVQKGADFLDADVLVPGWRDSGRVLQASKEAGVVVLDFDVKTLKLVPAGLKVVLDIYVGNDEAGVAELQGTSQHWSGNQATPYKDLP